MMNLFVCLNEDGFPDSWSHTELPGSVSFDESELPENYGVEFAERKWQVIDGELVPSEKPAE
jgi:hypothetical protein